jgi:hypothetical protein
MNRCRVQQGSDPSTSRSMLLLLLLLLLILMIVCSISINGISQEGQSYRFGRHSQLVRFAWIGTKQEKRLGNDQLEILGFQAKFLIHWTHASRKESRLGHASSAAAPTSTSCQDPRLLPRSFHEPLDQSLFLFGGPFPRNTHIVFGNGALSKGF